MWSFGSHVGTNLVQRGNRDEINHSTAVLFKIADWQDKLPGQTRSERRTVRE